MDIKSVGRRIRKYRTDKGWSQEQLAEYSGLSVTYTGMLERGEKLPAMATFITLSNTLGVSPDVLLADLITTRAEIKSSEMIDEICALEPEAQERIFSVVNTMIEFEKKK